MSAVRSSESSCIASANASVALDQRNDGVVLVILVLCPQGGAACTRSADKHISGRRGVGCSFPAAVI